MIIEDLVSDELHCISMEKSVRYAAEQMNELKIGSLVVVDNGTVTGIVTSKDIRSVHPNRIVADAMSADPICISKSAFIEDALSLMERHQVERLVVKDGEEFKGIVTREVLNTARGKYVDLLTGLYRSAYIEYLYRYFIDRDSKFHILFIDLNDFGSINKKYGHPVGDELLIQFSSMLKELAGSKDYLCRYGGDEFTIMSVRTLDEVQELLTALKEPINFNGIKISASTGFVSSEEREAEAFTFQEAIVKASKRSTSLKQKE